MKIGSKSNWNPACPISWECWIVWQPGVRELLIRWDAITRQLNVNGNLSSLPRESFEELTGSTPPFFFDLFWSVKFFIATKWPFNKVLVSLVFSQLSGSWIIKSACFVRECYDSLPCLSRLAYLVCRTVSFYTALPYRVSYSSNQGEKSRRHSKIIRNKGGEIFPCGFAAIPLRGCTSNPEHNNSKANVQLVSIMKFSSLNLISNGKSFR